MIYFDQAATSRPKARGVGEAMRAYIDDVCFSVNRSSYEESFGAAAAVLEARERLCRLFGFPDPAHVVFTPGQTYSLNTVVKGYLRPGDHVLVSPLEHNAVMRPLHQLLLRGVTFDRIPMCGDDELDLGAAERLMRPNTRLCVLTHASNVSGTILPIERMGELCRARGVALLVDAAQTAGHWPIDLSHISFDAFAVPGHKGLRGPGGIGALLLKPSFAQALEPLVTGGTGSDSEREEQPRYMPDRLEPGTPNLAGIYGLAAALGELLETGVDTRRAHELALLTRFYAGLDGMRGVRAIGTQALSRRVGVLSLDFTARDNAEVADRLANEFGILTRCGLHCTPSAHRAYGTFPQGTVRFSFGCGNTEAEVDAALAALETILRD